MTAKATKEAWRSRDHEGGTSEMGWDENHWIRWKMLTWAGTPNHKTYFANVHWKVLLHTYWHAQLNPRNMFLTCLQNVNTCHVLFINKTLSNEFEFRHIILYYIISYYLILYFIMLYYIKLYYIILYHIIL